MRKIIIGIIFFYYTMLLPVAIIGHRGAGYAPENTLTSFARAIESNVDMIEFDVHKCASGELVVFHDAKVDRITDGHGYVAELTLDELKQLWVLGSEQIPTLLELLDFVNRRVKLYIELKGADIAHDVVNIIEYYVQEKDWQYEDFLVASFDHRQLYEVKIANSFIPVAALFYGIPVDFKTMVNKINPQVICLNVDFINQRCVDDIHNHAMLVYVYTVNDQEDLVRLLSYGVDGIVTDYPDYISTFFSSKLALYLSSS